jgi:hypothetical protein
MTTKTLDPTTQNIRASGLRLIVSDEARSRATDALKMAGPCEHRSHNAKGLYPFTSDYWRIECGCGAFVEISGMTVAAAGV